MYTHFIHVASNFAASPAHMAASGSVQQCICHDEGVVGDDFKHFTDSTWVTFLKSVGVWKDLVGGRAEIAKNFVAKNGGFTDIAMPKDATFHHRCYKYFTDSTKQARGMKAAARELERKRDSVSNNADGMFANIFLELKSVNVWQYV